MIGDSLTTHLLGYNWSPFFWLNGLNSHGALQLVANAGVSGNTVANMNSRLANAYTNATPGLAGLGTLGWIFVRAGTNDARASTSIASLAAGYTSLLNSLMALASKVVILAVPPIGSSESSFAAKNALTIDYNDWLSTFAAANSSQCIYVADDVNLRDGSGAQLAGFFNADGIHNAGKATYQEGVDAAAALASLVNGYGYASPLSTDAADVYPAQPQWFANPTIAGTGGSAGSGFTGSVANSITVAANGGSITGTVSIVAADGGDANTTPWQRITPTQVTRTGAGESIRITSTLAGRSITGSDPASLDMMVEIRLTAFDANYFSSLLMWIQGSSGVMTHDLALKMGGTTITKTLVLRHAMPRADSSTHSSATLYMDLLISANNTGSMGTIDFRCLTVRG